MALTYNIGYDYTSVIGDKEIKFKQWTAKEERNYLQLIEKEDSEINDKVVFDTLLAPCIEDKEIVLSASEQKKLLVDIRIESISDSIVDNHKCSNCGKETDINVKINDCLTYKKSNYEEVQVKDLKFVFEEIKTNKEKEKLNLNDGVVNYIFTDFLLHIKGVEINGEMQETFSFRELSKFIDKLPTKIFDEVFEKYRDMTDDLIIEHKFICNKCNNEETIDYTHIPNLLWA